ncbi:hypothetical protein M885DRAFT_546978 [Pelagophyceae sp. CCMP2097]|nr:hypothetical protein M885DRAFT_546978 [Pelagophyceae sp. CCMP2097]
MQLLLLLAAAPWAAAFRDARVGGPRRGGASPAKLRAKVDRVAVCGPAGGVSDAVAEVLALHVSDVLRGGGASDAAVVCADRGDVPAAKREDVATLESLMASVLKKAPKRVVIVAPDDAAADAQPKRGGFPFGLGPSQDKSVRELAAAALAAGAQQVAIVRHGALFGGGKSAAFEDGLRVAPILVDDFSRRGVRIAMETTTKDSSIASRRFSVGEAAAYVAISDSWTGSGVVEFGVRAATGLYGPADRSAWSLLLADVLADGVDRPVFRCDVASAKLVEADWLVDEWAPTALRTIDATMAVTGSRPVQAVRREGVLAALYWETFDGETISKDGELTFELVAAEAGGAEAQLVVKRRSRAPLLGEAELLDKFADAIAARQAAWLAKNAPAVAAAAPAPAAAANPAPAPPAPAAAVEAADEGKPKRRRAAAVRSRAGAAPAPAAPDED